MSAAAVHSVTINDGIHELAADLSGSPYFSSDMAPITRAGRRWATRDMAALWISMSACIPTYQLASGMIDEGCLITLGSTNCRPTWRPACKNCSTTQTAEQG